MSRNIRRSVDLASAALGALLAVSPALPARAESNQLDITIDEAKVVRLDRPAAEIIVGNPSIADVAVQSGKVLVVTGKSFGRTNLIVIDGDGKEITNRYLSVEEPQTGLITLHEGAQARATYYCAPFCTSALSIGDDKDYFENVSKQMQTKQSMGQATAEGSKPGE